MKTSRRPATKEQSAELPAKEEPPPASKMATPASKNAPGKPSRSKQAPAPSARTGNAPPKTPQSKAKFGRGSSIADKSSKTFTMDEEDVNDRPRTTKSQRKSRTKRKFINTVRAIARMAQLRSLRGDNLFRPAELDFLQENGVRSLTDYDEYSTDSDDEVVHVDYKGLGYDDASRYEVRHAHLGLRASSDQLDRPPPTKDHTTRARKVYFYRNGDSHLKAKLVLVTNKKFPQWRDMLNALGKELPTVAGVKHVFSLPDGKEIRSVQDLKDDSYYVCGSVNRLTWVDYGNTTESFWRNGKPMVDESHLFSHKNGTLAGSAGGKPQKAHVITVISNMCRTSHEKMILNPKTTQNFESLLLEAEGMLTIPHPPVTAIFTETTHVKVQSFSQLFHDLLEHKNFLVCGQEGEPVEPVEPKKHALPSSHSSNDSLTADGGAQPDSQSPRKRGGPAKRTESIKCIIDGKKREFFAPSGPFIDSDGAKPDKQMKLEWVYGFRGYDVKQNLVVLPNTGELVYFVAAVVVLCARDKRGQLRQRHYTSHTEEVTCIALHPRFPFIASGQVAGDTIEVQAHVRVWDAEKLSTYAVIGIGAFQRGVACIAFSEGKTNGDLLLAIDDSDNHVMSVWDWTVEDNDEPVCMTPHPGYILPRIRYSKTTLDPVVSGCFYPWDDKTLITFGKKHIFFWKRKETEAGWRILRDKHSGQFEDDAPKFVTSVCFDDKEYVITGDSTGSILVWRKDAFNVFRVESDLSLPMKYAHKRNVSSLVMLPNGVLISGGGSEIKVWDSRDGFRFIKGRELPEAYGVIRKIAPTPTTGQDGYMYIGTARNLIIEGSLQSKFQPVVQGHSEELWAVKAHPAESAFFTAGHDCSLIKWSADKHRVIWSNTRNKTPCTSLAVDPLGQLVAVGASDGKVTLYGAGDGAERTFVKISAVQVNAMSFSPDGKELAIGCHDGYVHICVLQSDGKIKKIHKAALRHNSSFIMHLDWSSDSHFLQTVLGDYQLIYWDTGNMQKLESGRTMRDVNWATFSACVGYPLVGPWGTMGKKEVVNVACRSKYLEYIVTGDSKGRLRLFKYPSCQPKADYWQVKPFSSNTTAVEFLFDDSGILASGGNDAALMHYVIKK